MDDLMKCPVPVVVRGYTEDGNDYVWQPPARCGADLYVQVTSFVDLDWLWAQEHDAEQLNSTQLDQYADSGVWKVRCSSGHVIAVGTDESGEPLPFTWKQIPNLGTQPQEA